MKKGSKHTPKTRAQMSSAKRGRKQTPEHIAAVVAARAASRANRQPTVSVSRNDAAMLEITRQYFEGELAAGRGYKAPVVGPTMAPVAEIDLVNIVEAMAASDRFMKAGKAWLDGNDVLLAKLAQ